ncbi:HNH endonuclease family protein [Protaetiibacter larvae]|uniref:HNH endonuclease family protein n=1 Tax=Protaetiibacter larvae TaxID=2592654 RepID=UPI00143D5171|nr:HNH endonuclease family protein [Protaetiibacter larvae]
MSRGDLPTFSDFASIGSRSTEHILPQDPAEASRWRKDFSDEQHRDLVHGIGNLVLTRDNSAYGRKDYADKRGVTGQDQPRCYLSPTALIREREIGETYAEWTPASVEARRQAIERWALRRWYVEPPTDQELGTAEGGEDEDADDD